MGGGRRLVILAFDLFGERIEITEALLRVSAGIGAFAGLYYSIAVLTDSTYREEFLDELTERDAGELHGPNGIPGGAGRGFMTFVAFWWTNFQAPRLPGSVR